MSYHARLQSTIPQRYVIMHFKLPGWDPDDRLTVHVRTQVEHQRQSVKVTKNICSSMSVNKTRAAQQYTYTIRPSPLFVRQLT